MMKKINKVILLFVFFNICFFTFSNSKQSSQVIKAGHWIYDDLKVLEAESGCTMFLERQPLSVGEIQFCLKDIDYNYLSEPGKKLFNKVQSFLDEQDDFFPDKDGVRVFLNVVLSPELCYKSNSDIDWYFNANKTPNPITFPIILGLSDYFTIESDLFIGKTQAALNKSDNFTNIPLYGSEFEFNFPDFANFSSGLIFDDWGVTAQLGKEGMTIGNTELGSIVYNDTFKTDFYTQLSLFNDYFKFTMNVSQIDKSKFYYIHNLNLKPFKKFNISVIEGNLVNAPFELRFLNPLMIMHQLGSYYDYDDFPNPESGESYEKYGEGRVCAFLGFTFEFIPIRNLRIYGLYAQNEILDAGGSRTQASLSVPDSLGGQLGAEYFIPLNNGNYLNTGLEIVYTSPYLYVKHSPDWSLYSEKGDMQGPGTTRSWVGSPFGPDCFAVQAKAEYDTHDKWSVGTNLLFKIHGENTAENLFNKGNKKFVTEYQKDKDGNFVYLCDKNGNLLKDENGNNIKVVKNQYWYWSYYPSVSYEMHKGDPDAQAQDVHDGRYMWMTGTPEFTGQIAIDGHYKILENLDLSGRFVYTFVFNNKNILNNFNQGAEFSVALKYDLF